MPLSMVLGYHETRFLGILITVKGAKRLGVPVGNWLTAKQGKRLLLTADGTSLRGRRDDVRLAILPVADYAGRNRLVAG